MMVVLHHLSFSDSQLGPFGVKIFFIISGFIMWSTTASMDISPISFWRRRLVRIVPLYWLFLSLLLAIALSAPQLLKTTAVTPEAVVKSFLFIPHYHTVQMIIAPILIPGWSLDFEVFFYFIFGLALLIKSPGLRAVAIGGILGGLVLLGLSLDPRDAIAATYTSPNLVLFVDGVILAIAYRAFDVDSAVLGLIFICIGVLWGSIHISNGLGVLRDIIGVAPALIVAGTLALEPMVRRAPISVLHTIGNASYSIYLAHLFLLRLFELSWRHFSAPQSGSMMELTYVVCAFIFAIAGGIAVHYFVERPMLVLFHRHEIAARPA